MMYGQKVMVAGSFAELVQHHMSHLMNVIQMTAQYGEMLPEQLVLYHKVDKHYQAENPRSVAMYIAMFASEFPNSEVPAGVKFKAKSMGLKADAKLGVGYPHADGTYHWFSV